MAKRQVQTYERAFTIIEVVLVLAIAGLIFLMVFIALPALQRAQRNTERKRQVDVVFTGVIDYQKNNKNNPPCVTSKNGWWGCDYDVNFISRYVDKDCEFDYQQSGLYYYSGCDAPFTDPDGTTYNIMAYGDTTRQRRYVQQPTKEETKPVVSLESGLNESIKTMAATTFGRQASAEDLYDHTMFILFGYLCSVTEGKAYWTGKPNDFLVALRLEGGGMYCHGSGTGEENYGEYSIVPDWGGYYGEPV